jgi:hypothetical protein
VWFSAYQREITVKVTVYDFWEKNPFFSKTEIFNKRPFFIEIKASNMSDGERYMMPRRVLYRSLSTLVVVYSDGHREEFTDKERIRWVLLENHALVSVLIVSHPSIPPFKKNIVTKKSVIRHEKSLFLVFLIIKDDL